MITSRDDFELAVLENLGDIDAAEQASAAVGMALLALAEALGAAIGADPGTLEISWRVIDSPP